MTTPSWSLKLPDAGGQLVTHRMQEPVAYPKPASPFTARIAFAAPHVVADTRAEYTPGVLPPVDWEATLAFRHHLWSYGIGVAEAMDTSERGPDGLNWSQAQELISTTLAEAKTVDGLVACGAGTDQLDTSQPLSLAAVVEAYLEQLSFIEDNGGAAIIRASHQLVSVASSEQDYLSAYSQVLESAKRPVIVHWLGTVFDPSLRGYWGHEDTAAALEVVLALASANSDKLRGIKFSLLDPKLEIELRQRLPTGVDVYTGDDYDYPELILGDGDTYSHGLLGVLDPLAPIASLAFQELEDGDDDRFLRLMRSTVPLAVKMFEPPAARYKTGTVFIAYLSGHQDHFRMISGREGMRSARHLTDLFLLADELGLFPDPELAARRMQLVLATSGIS
jgi:hypothetical protein